MGLLLAAALPAGLLTVTATPALAATTTTEEALDLYTHPGFLTVAGDGTGLTYDVPTINGMVVSAYGYHDGQAPPAAQQAAVFDTYGSSQPIASAAIGTPYAIAAGYRTLPSNGDLQLATLSHHESGGADLRLSEGQGAGFTSSRRSVLSPDVKPVALAIGTQFGADGATEGVAVTGGPTGLRVHTLDAFGTQRAHLGTDGNGSIDVLDLHNTPDTDAAAPGATNPTAPGNGTVTVLFRSTINGDPTVTRATVVISQDESFTTSISLRDRRSFVLEGPAVAGQTRARIDGVVQSWITAVRVAKQDGVLENVLLEPTADEQANAFPGSPAAQPTGQCQGDSPPGVEIRGSRFGGDGIRFACTTVVKGATGANRLRTTVLRDAGEFNAPHEAVEVTTAVPGLPVLNAAFAPVPLLDEPDVSARLAADNTYKATFSAPPPFVRPRQTVAVRTLLRGRSGPGQLARTAVASTSVTDEFGRLRADAPLVLTMRAGGTAVATAPLLGVPLGMPRNRVEIERNTAFVDQQSNPVPLAFVQAPPTVRGAQQGDGTSATYGKTTGSGTTQGTSTSTRIGASLGIEWEDPAGVFGASVEATYTREVEQSYETGRSIETTESYTGAAESNNVVYRSDQLRRHTGIVKRSSMGVALGTPVEFDIPLGSVVSVAPVESLQARFPEFRAGGSWARAVGEAFPNQAGDPGSYLEFGGDGAVLDTYCNGTRNGGPSSREVTPPGAYTPVNPFIDREPAKPGPDILVGERHRQTPGSGVAEGTDISVIQDQPQAFVSSHSLDVSAQFKGGYVTAEVSAGASWAKDWSSTLSTGQGFSAEVASIPSAALTQEAYDWRMFVCRETLTGPGGAAFPAFVQGFLVDDYVGSGGLEDMSPVQLATPIESQVVDTATALTFSQPTGSVRKYDYRIEAVGRNQVFTGTAATYADVQQGTPGRVGGRPQAVSFAAPQGLLANQLFRWQVTAENFFGTVVASDYEFFTVDGPPHTVVEADTLTPGDTVTFINNTYITDLQDRATCTYDSGDGTVLVEEDVAACKGEVTHVYATSGSYNVTLKVCVEAGCSTDRLLVTVNGTAVDDTYQVLEDSRTLVGQLPSVLANDGGRFATLLNQTSHGALELRADGFFGYRPDPDFCGTDVFSYSVDGNSQRVATATLTVLCQQDAPRPVDDEFTATEDTTLTVTAPGLLVNDVDPDSTPVNPVVLGSTLADPPAHGTAEVSPDGALRYVPARGSPVPPGDDRTRPQVSSTTFSSLSATVHSSP